MKNAKEIAKMNRRSMKKNKQKIRTMVVNNNFRGEQEKPNENR